MSFSEMPSMPEKKSEERKSLVEMFRERPITLLDEFPVIDRETLEDMYPGKDIVVCDFRVADAEQGGELPGGYVSGYVMSVDHHAATPRMARQISSTTLAIGQVKAEPFPKDAVVLIHHTDCDSILSSAIVREILPPDDRFDRAAIAADHTGEENDIADLLQGLQKRRDVGFSLRNLDLLLHHEALEPEAEALLAERRKERSKAETLVKKFHSTGSVFYISTTEHFDSAFFPALLPQAAVILVSSPMKDGSGKFIIKARLGMRAPEGFALNTLGLPDFGGRWNAGNTKRNGGTAVPIGEYAGLIQKKLDASVPVPHQDSGI